MRIPRDFGASAGLSVDKETDEWNCVEPVMFTFSIEAVSGVAGNTRASLVNEHPGEIASGVDAGNRVHIADREGDVWLRNVQPLGLDVVTQALAARGEVPVPMVELGGRAAAMKLDSNYTKATREPIHAPVLRRGSIEVCGGLLRPASVLDGKTQSWTTTCKGSYLENHWAEYRLDAQGWRVANW